MNKTKIDWATMSWNPVTGCRHGCPYCYARRTATRFNAGLEDPATLAGGLHVLPEKIKATPYPYGFEPTLHRYRLGQPQNTKEPQTVFVCSMADLFGRWVPTSWIVEVLDVNFCSGISREDIARQAGVHPAQVSRLVREFRGITLSAYITELRMEYARKLLSSGTLKIGEIARRLGYSYPNYFIRVFREHFKSSPEEWRNELRRHSRS